MSFRSETLGALRNYVYALSEPSEDGAIFYVGKGTGNRCFAHALEDRKDPDFPKEQDSVMSLKVEKIREIKEKYNEDPRITIIAHGIEDADMAFSIESMFIKVLSKTKVAPDMTNAVAGKKSENYWLTVNELDNKSAPAIKESELTKKILIVSLKGNKNVCPYPKIKTDAELTERTLGDWNVSEAKAKNVDLIVGVYENLIRSVCEINKVEKGERRTSKYEITSEKETKNKKTIKRLRFHGTRDKKLEKEWIGRSIINGEGKVLTKMGSGGAFRYANI